MFSRKFTLLFSFFLILKLTEGQRRIFEGDDLRYNLHKYLVNLHFKNYHGISSCTGSIINSKWIVTAAHCIHPDMIHARVVHGIRNNVIAKVDKVDAHGHPDYDLIEMNVRRDIALLHIRHEIQFNDDIQPIELVTSEPASGVIGVIAGYGVHENEVEAPREAPVVISKCPLKNTTVLCSNNFSGGRGDHGDSGGPLLYNWRLAGILSTGLSMDSLVFTKKISFTSYASISDNLKWLNSVMNGKL